MRRLIVGTAVFAPLLMGVAILCAASTPDDIRLPGREVSSIEASTMKGGGCGGYISSDCTCSNGQTAIPTAGGDKSLSTNGCDSTCTVQSATTACST